MNNYDVIIIGAGVIGASCARYLSRYNLKTLVLERHNDVGDETSSANSAIVHSGYDPKPNTLKAKFNVLGNKMMPNLCEELDVAFIKNGSLTVGFTSEDRETLLSLLERAKINGVKARLVEHDELMEIEPNLNKEALCAILCEDAGVISPFALCVGLMENAIDNGVTLKLNQEVVEIIKDEGYILKTKDNNEYKCRVLINAAGLNSALITKYLEEPRFTITPRKGEYILLDHFDNNWIKHTLFMCPTKVGKGVLVSPTSSYNYIIGPSNSPSESFDVTTDTNTFTELKEIAKKLVKDIPYQETIREFAGVRANPNTDDFIIEESKINKGFINVAGIMSPGLASSPAIGEYVSDLVRDIFSAELNNNFNPRVRKHYHYEDTFEYEQIIKKDPKFGRIVCRCEKVSEGEIVDVINRSCGARTVKGVKKRCRPGFGKCQGTFCQQEVIKILSRELNIPLNEVLYSEKGTNILKYPSKGEK